MRNPAAFRHSILSALLFGCWITEAGAALPLEGLRTSAGATYRGTAVPVDVDVFPHPGVVGSAVSAGPGTVLSIFTEPALTFDQARAEARASSLPGTIGSYSHAGVSSGLPGLTTASSTAQRVTYHRAISADPSVTHASIDFTVSYHGSLFVAESGNADGFASVSAALLASIATSTTPTIVFNANATLFKTGLTFGFVPSGTPMWRASFVEMTSPPAVHEERYFEMMAYTESFMNAFTVPIGDTYAIDFRLATEARTPDAVNAWAIADFLASGGFEMSTSTPGVTLVALSAPVPWPAPIWLWLAGGACLALSRRRRVTGCPSGRTTITTGYLNNTFHKLGLVSA
jgi:hypothetical protein